MFKKFKEFKELLYPLKYAGWYLYIKFFMDLFGGVTNIAIIYFSSFIILALENKSSDLFYFRVKIIIVLIIIKIIYIFFDDSLINKIDTNIRIYLDKKYLKKYVYLDNNKVESYGTGKLQNIIFSGTLSWVNYLFRIELILIDILSIGYIFIIVALKSPNVYYFIGFTFAFFAIVFFFSKGIRIIHETRKKSKELGIIADGKRVKILMSKFEILQNNKINKELSGYTKILEEISNIWWYSHFKKNTWQIWAFIITDGMLIVVYLVIGIGILSGNYSIANLALLLWLIQNLSRYTWSIRGNFREIYNYLINIDKLLALFEEIKTIPGLKIKQEFNYKKGDISFRNTTFGYNNNLIYDNFNLDIKGGNKTALVGDSGSGKTTLVKLVAGYVSPNSGDILVDNQNIAEYNLISYYKHIGYLTQEPSVFDGTIRDNLLYALKDEPEISEVDKVIKNAKCEFIYEFPNGLETEIGEKGIKLSGGQKQRIAIAKIMLKNPNIIILDEPTSALDSISEQFISEALKNLFEGKTVIIIAHRLQTVKEADDIIVLKDSQIIERGTHDELSKIKDGEYKKMLDLQTSF